MATGPSADLGRPARTGTSLCQPRWRVLGTAAVCLLLAAAGPTPPRVGAAEKVAHRVRPDVTTVIGDAIQSGNPDRLRQAARWFDSWRARPRSPVLAIAAIRLAAACRERRACDGYYALRYARLAADLGAVDTRLLLAREYLGLDLPWYALEILADGRAGPPTPPERALHQRALGAGAIIVQDAAAAAARPAADGARGRVAERLWYLLGVPSIEATGSYLGAEFHYAPRRSSLTDADYQSYYRTSRRGWLHSHSIRPTLTDLFSRSYRPDLERIYELQPPGAAPGIRVPISVAALGRLLHLALARTGGDEARERLSTLLSALEPRSEDFGAVAPAEAPGLLGPAIGEEAPPAGGFELLHAGYRDGVWLLSTNGDPWSGSSHYALVPRPGGLYGYALGSGGSASLEDVDGQPGPEIVLVSAEGSGSFMDASVFFPRTATTAQIATTLYRGQLAFLDLDGDAGKEVVISQALSLDARFADCNQCPKRRSAYVLDFDDRSRRYRAVGAVLTGTEDAGNAIRNLFGMSATMFGTVYATETQSALARLRASDAAPVSGEDIDTVLRQALLMIEAGHFADSLRLSGSVTRRLEPLRELAFRERYLGAQTMAAHAEIQSGIPLAAIARLRGIPDGIVGSRDAASQTYWSILGVAAMTVGDATLAFDAMRREQGVAPASNRSPGQGNLAMLYSHFGAWRSARAQTIAALDMSLREENDVGLALMMISLAEAERRNRDFGAALDWLARALRLARSSPDTASVAYALQVAVAVALDAELPDMAIAMLDLGLLSQTPAIWRQRGPDHLLLYARALEQKGMLDEASRASVAAARVAELRAGLRSVEAWGEVGRLALGRTDETAAREAYRRAFDRIAHGRRTTPTDSFKISFLQNVATIAEQHFALSSAESPDDVGRLAADLEAWKFQVFRDRYASASRVEPNIIGAVQRRLRGNEAYISYFISDSVSFATVVTRDAVRRRALDITAPRARQLRAEILGFMDLSNPTSAAYIRERRMPRRLHRLLQEARTALIAPLGIGGEIDTLLINEDEDLVGLPWSAVPPKNDSWLDSIRWALGFPRVRSLLERYRIAMVPTAEMIVRETGPRGPARRVVIAAALGPIRAETVSRALGVASREDRYAPLPPLPQGVPEVEAVRAAFNGRPELLLDGFAARRIRAGSRPLGRETLRMAATQSTVWHFVGHGVFNRIDPMGSTIFLGDGPAPESVQASALAEWDLRRVSFVALSACETGTARPEVGAETFGLLRGLLGGGVRTAMVMGWPVDDLAASRFYQSFYIRFDAESRGDGHRRATLEAKNEFTHPFYWSAATLYGDWR